MRKLLLCLPVLGVAGGVSAHEFGPGPLAEITVYGRADSLLGLANSATQGTVGSGQLEQRPVLRTGEVLETVPGVIITQHAGGGKANQYFMRAFNLDHGTDFATTLDGMPVNLPSHGHGQGYSDMNIVIPELVDHIDYQKGVYYAANGDFSSAGGAQIETFKAIPRDIYVLEGGMYGYGRGMAAIDRVISGGDLVVAGEVQHSDGPWVRGDNFWKKNGLLRYGRSGENGAFRITVRGYHGRWNSSDQVAESAVAMGVVPFYGSLDDTTGGRSQRYSVQGDWYRSTANTMTRVNAYSFYYDMDLFSNFTYFLNDPVRGDQFEQIDKRWTSGLTATHARYDTWGERAVETSFGVNFRNDQIDNGLFNTSRRARIGTVRQDSIGQYSFGAYVQNGIHWTETLRSEIGLRGDVHSFDVRSGLAANSGRRSDAIVSPKASLIFRPWVSSEIYVQAGRGFHSNDARGVLTTIDPATGDPVDRADPLVRTQGAEIGFRSEAIQGLHSTVSLWMLDIKSELVFVGDAGATEASRPSRRIGVEFANYYTPLDWLTIDADFAFSRARYREFAPEGRRIPGAIEAVIATGVTATSPTGLSGSLRLRYFGSRPLIEDNSFRSRESVAVNARVAFAFNERWSVAADVFNLLDRRDHDIDYAYESRITPTAIPAEEIHFHPVEPRQIRVSLKARY